MQYKEIMKVIVDITLHEYSHCRTTSRSVLENLQKQMCFIQLMRALRDIRPCPDNTVLD